ncbi:MAG: hypothetical protein HN780_06060 [Gemmatimonadetes bacterium]|jgi:hypothetical protein|nr:hypothetical protein [Gemmatimonadota bacterium]MBT7418070.1 hypothetical protein [Gemmatimonadota bacterium]|tara:strand:+ start:928 stop:1584 length:657 start_codon:yes stop_codon:yes gene_type:complete
MHSSSLRDSDFQIIADGTSVELCHYFSGYSNTKRLGLFAPNRLEGVGAITLVMAHVTAFYNTYRANNEEFFAYPDYFTFQSLEPKAIYSLFDIWPDHKSVAVSTDSVERLNAITDRAINILLVPAGASTAHDFERQQLAAATRLIDTCYIYSEDGTLTDPDLVIRCNTDPFDKWIESVFNSIPGGEAAAKTWRSAHNKEDTIEQSFRRIGLQEALTLL